MSQTMSNRPQPGTVSAGHSSRNGVYQNRSHNVKPLGVYPEWNIQHVLVHVISGVSNICGHLKSPELFGMIPEIDHDRSWCMIFRSLQHSSYRWNEWIVTFTNPNKKHASLLWSINLYLNDFGHTHCNWWSSDICCSSMFGKVRNITKHIPPTCDSMIMIYI